MIRRVRCFCIGSIGVFSLVGCATTHPQNHTKAEPITTNRVVTDTIRTAPATSQPSNEPAQMPEPDLEPDLPNPKLDPAPESDTFDSQYSHLTYWQNTDPRPALTAFQKTCRSWKKRDKQAWLSKGNSQFGQIKDWLPACRKVLDIDKPFQTDAIHFFQTHFEPVISQSPQDTGLLTGYYAPEIAVRKTANAEFNAPLLARPNVSAIQNLPRSALSDQSATALAYGRPIDVFFLQIQGSGQIKFKDGTTFMAAYNGHNGHIYKSIGRVLIQNGELKKGAVSKQAIETWMQNVGVERAQDLMNNNPRYIYFKLEPIKKGVGPKGAAGVPLTPMGSLAIDPRNYPYGLPIWLEANLPVKGGDFDGQATGLLVITQDTGSAIKGKGRGDLYFGIGGAAGAKAGVMKHKARWTVLLPTALAIKLAEENTETKPSS
ncbi:MAG: MltA domain-containing protein [Robiginitomaculum sp.]|nr:MltA domain-containing protein [Robiginitomaculum sp.]